MVCGPTTGDTNNGGNCTHSIVTAVLYSIWHFTKDFALGRVMALHHTRSAAVIAPFHVCNSHR